MKLPQKQKKIIIFVAGGLLALFLFLQLIYIPKRKQIHKLQSELNILQSNIKMFQSLLEAEEAFSRRISEMQSELQDLDKRLSKEEKLSSVIRQLTESAENLNIEIASINPGSRQIYKDPQGKELTLEDCFCLVTPIELNLKGRYQSLGQYLESLDKAILGLYTIDRLTLERDEQTVPNLKISLIISVYTLSQTKP